jgi:release factor glutamine methyltransferase
MAQHVLDFEPELALFVSDDNPLIFYQQIAEFALKKLALNGALYVELNENLAHETKALLNKIGFKHTMIRQDLQGRNRMLKAWL